MSALAGPGDGREGHGEGGGGGCFVPGSLVLTETNEAFPIEDISLGDVVAGGGRVTAILQFDGSTEDL